MKIGLSSMSGFVALLTMTIAVPAATAASNHVAHIATPALSLMCGPQSCARATLSMLNDDRRRAGIAPLLLATRQSTGKGDCVGSYGHSTAMERSGNIWHINASYPRASFPHNLCVTYTSAGENVGDASSGDSTLDIQALDRLMMGEPHGASCASMLTHACNILNGKYRQVGIGVYVTNGETWLTEDFVG